MPTVSLCDLPVDKRCSDPDHNPLAEVSGHMRVGIYEHVCPSCLQRSRVRCDGFSVFVQYRLPPIR
jgi:hypothetical protein